jgi:dihydroflavonol-4-reductase
MSKVLLTGATGFIGHHLVDLLKSEGFDVRCLVRKTSNISNLVGKVEFVYGEVTSPESLEEAVKSVDYVVHLAGVVKALNPEGYYRVNTQGTINLFNAILKSNPNIKRFVFISSQAASKPSEVPIKENEPSAPVTSYGKSKLEAEKFLNQNSDKLPITIIRPSAVYGPGDKEFLPVYKMISKGIEILVKGGRTKISFVYVKDLVKSIYLAMLSEKTVGKTYFSCHPEVIELIDFYKAIEEALGKKFVLRIKVPVPVMYFAAMVNTGIAKLLRTPAMFNFEKVNELTNSWVASPEEIIKDTSMKYEYDIKAGVRETIAWAKENKLV